MNPASLLMIDLSGPSLTPDERAFLGERRPGGVCLFARNVSDRFQLADYVAELRSLAGDQLIVAVDQEGGGVVRVLDLPYAPSAMALGAADDPALTRAVAAATARGLRSVGIDVDFAPVADVNSNPANPVIADRAFGGDPAHVARHVVAFVEGLQAEGVAATVKHFPGHGDASVDSHLALPKLELTFDELERRELVPFIAAFEAGVAAVMSAHIVLERIDPQYPATLSPTIIGGLLRDRLGFEGVVFSDALEMRAIADRWGGPESAVMALAAGVDMPAQVATLQVQEATVAAIDRAIAEGRLDPAKLAAAQRRLAALKRLSRPQRAAADAWAPGDDGLLDRAAQRALLALGPLPRLAAGSRVVLVAAKATRQSAATQATVSPAEGLAAALRERGVDVVEVPYDPQEAGAVLGTARREAESAELLLFASTARTVLQAGEVALARDLAAATGGSDGSAVHDEPGGAARAPAGGPAFVHVALWNPYLVTSVPGPALVTFGWRERSVRAAAAALLGEVEATARAPVELRTA